nr:iron chelate uptake ABC transporter family permease subunit [Arthrobacter sp. BF1]
MAVLVLAIVAVGLWHLTQGTSGVGPRDLLRLFTGAQESVGGVPVSDVLTGSRLPRLFAGVAVGFALGAAGALLQSVTRNVLASPDTLAVTAGSYFALSLVAAFGLAVPLWASSGVAFVGGLLAAALVLGLAGNSAGNGTTRLILAGSATAMALDAATAMLLILFKENTTGLFAWGSGSLAQLNLDASVRAAPVIIVVLCVAFLLCRRLDVLKLGDDQAATLGVPIRSTRLIAVICAVVLTSISVTLAGPIAFVGLGAPVLARLIANRVQVLHRHLFLLPLSGLLGALLILLADAVLRGILSAEGATSIPTGIPTAMLGAVLIVILALRMRDSGSIRQPPHARIGIHSRRRFIAALVSREQGETLLGGGSAVVHEFQMGLIQHHQHVGGDALQHVGQFRHVHLVRGDALTNDAIKHGGTQGNYGVGVLHNPSFRGLELRITFTFLASVTACGGPSISQLATHLINPRNIQSLGHGPNHQAVGEMRGGVHDVRAELNRHFEEFLGLLLQARVRRWRKTGRNHPAVAYAVDQVFTHGKNLANLNRVSKASHGQDLTASFLLGEQDGMAALSITTACVGQRICQEVKHTPLDRHHGRFRQHRCPATKRAALPYQTILMPLH